jgi:hypothetical protein
LPAFSRCGFARFRSEALKSLQKSTPSFARTREA